MASTPLVVVLAAGANSRLAPLREKSLLRFGETSLLVRQLTDLAAAGFEEAVVVTNPDNDDAVRTELADLRAPRCNFAVQNQPRGMGDALLAARTAIPDGRAIYVTQSHDVVEPRLPRAMLDAWRSGEAEGYLAARRVSTYFPGGYIAARDRRVLRIVEKPGPGNEPSALVTIVAHLINDSRRLLDLVEAEYRLPATTDDHYERALNQLAERARLRIVEYEGAWLPIKYPWHVLDVMDFFLGQLQGIQVAPGARVSELAHLSGPVLVEEGARVFPGACLSGPVYVGHDAMIGNNALVRGSMIGSRSVVGYSTEVCRSYVGADCWFHTNYIGDSVIADNVSFGSGGVTANFRLDEKSIPARVKGERIDTGRTKLGVIAGSGARIGINASTMPGVKIGEGAFVGPSVCLTRDAAPGTKTLLKQDLMVVEGVEAPDPAQRAALRQKLS